jgi:hypothetical protein
MSTARGAHKVDHVTITLVPKGDERTTFRVPSTFNQLDRTYAWRRAQDLEYMIVPTKISSSEVKVELFLHPQRRGKLQAKEMVQLVENFVEEKIQSEWRGLRLGSISRPTLAIPPRKSYIRGTIEEILGNILES